MHKGNSVLNIQIRGAMLHRRLVYIYLLNVPSFSSRYFNKIKRTSRLWRLLALSLEILYDLLASNRCVRFISRRKEKIQTSTTNLVFHACSAPFHKLFFFSCQPMKRRLIMFCVLSPLSCAKTTACYRVLKQQQHVV